MSLMATCDRCGKIDEVAELTFNASRLKGLEDIGSAVIGGYDSPEFTYIKGDKKLHLCKRCKSDFENLLADFFGLDIEKIDSFSLNCDTQHYSMQRYAYYNNLSDRKRSSVLEHFIGKWLGT